MGGKLKAIYPMVVKLAQASGVLHATREVECDDVGAGILQPVLPADQSEPRL